MVLWLNGKIEFIHVSIWHNSYESPHSLPLILIVTQSQMIIKMDRTTNKIWKGEINDLKFVRTYLNYLQLFSYNFTKYKHHMHITRRFFCLKFDFHQIFTVTITFNLWHATTRLTILQFLKIKSTVFFKIRLFLSIKCKIASLPLFIHLASWLQALIKRLISYIRVCFFYKFSQFYQIFFYK